MPGGGGGRQPPPPLLSAGLVLLGLPSGAVSARPAKTMGQAMVDWSTVVPGNAASFARKPDMTLGFSEESAWIVLRPVVNEPSTSLLPLTEAFLSSELNALSTRAS